MIEYSADIEYEVFSDGTAKVIERKNVHNYSDKKVTREKYYDTLPPDVAIDTIKSYLTIGGENRVELKNSISAIPGTDRKRLTTTSKDGSPLTLHPGITVITTEFSRNNFYLHKGKVYCFYFHHSLPKLDYLQGKTVPKTIKLIIHKPFSRFLYSFRLYSIDQPYGFDVDTESNFDKNIDLLYKFDLTNDSHYFNTVFIVKSFRIPHINLISYAIKQLIKSKGLSS